jgi:hypothetical protein
VAVASVVAEDIVVRLEHGGYAYGDRLLAHAAMGRSDDQALLEELNCAILEPANSKHLPVQLEPSRAAAGTSGKQRVVTVGNWRITHVATSGGLVEGTRNHGADDEQARSRCGKRDPRQLGVLVSTYPSLSFDGRLDVSSPTREIDCSAGRPCEDRAPGGAVCDAHET